MRERNCPFLVCALCGRSSVSGRPLGRPYMYTFSMLTMRAPVARAAARTPACSPGKRCPLVVRGVEGLVDHGGAGGGMGREGVVGGVSGDDVDVVRDAGVPGAVDHADAGLAAIQQGVHDGEADGAGAEDDVAGRCGCHDGFPDRVGLVISLVVRVLSRCNSSPVSAVTTRAPEAPKM